LSRMPADTCVWRSVPEPSDSEQHEHLETKVGAFPGGGVQKGGNIANYDRWSYETVAREVSGLRTRRMETRGGGRVRGS
jgi:hypothetical protein